MGLTVGPGQLFWDCPVCQGVILYLCLGYIYIYIYTYEKGSECSPMWQTAASIFANSTATTRYGLAEQIEYSVITHPNRKLVIIDAFQKAQGPSGGSIYASGNDDFSSLKAVADKHSPAMTVLRHTHKMAARTL